MSGPGHISGHDYDTGVVGVVPPGMTGQIGVGMGTGMGGGDALSRSSAAFASFARQKFSCDDFTFIKVLGKGSFGKVSTKFVCRI